VNVSCYVGIYQTLQIIQSVKNVNAVPAVLECRFQDPQVTRVLPFHVHVFDGEFGRVLFPQVIIFLNTASLLFNQKGIFSIFDFQLLWHVFIEKVQKTVQVVFTLPIAEIKDKGQRHNIKYIDFLGFAVFGQVPEEHFLVGEFVMVLKMIERVFEDFVIDTVFILVRLVALLPAKVQEQVLLIVNFLPLFSDGENAADQGTVVPRAQVVLEGGLEGRNRVGFDFFLFSEGKVSLGLSPLSVQGLLVCDRKKVLSSF
jgi:hypothetical protein